MVSICRQGRTPSRLIQTPFQPFIMPGGDEENPCNTTSYIRSEFGWCDDCLPIIIGQLDPDLSTYKFGLPVPFLKENGETVLDAHGNPIRDFQFLPRYLSSKLEPWRYEAYKRMDPRLTYTDLWARMPRSTTDINRNQINNERVRKVRRPFHCYAWDTKGPKLPKQIVLAAEFWTPNQIAYNTTWEIGPQGIRRGDSDIWLPLNTYLTNNVLHKASQRVQDALNERARLLAVAQAAGVFFIEDIPFDARPEMWNVRVGRRQLKTAGHEADDDEESGEEAQPLPRTSARFTAVNVDENPSTSSQPEVKEKTVLAMELPLRLAKRKAVEKPVSKNKGELKTGLEDSEASDERNEIRNKKFKISTIVDKNRKPVSIAETSNKPKGQDCQRMPQQTPLFGHTSTAATGHVYLPQMLPSADMTRLAGMYPQHADHAVAGSPLYMMPSHQYNGGMTQQFQQTMPTHHAQWGPNQFYQHSTRNENTIPSHGFHAVNVNSPMTELTHKTNLLSTMSNTTRPIFPNAPMFESTRQRPDWYHPQPVWSQPLLQTPSILQAPPILQSQPVSTEPVKTDPVKKKPKTKPVPIDLSTETPVYDPYRDNGVPSSPVFPPTTPEGGDFDEF